MILRHMAQTIILRSTIKSLVYAVSTVLIIMTLILVKPDLFSICPEYLSNFEHLNKTGSEVFCNAFSKFVLSREAGEDMSQYFYSEDAYMESVKDIVASYLPGYDNR